MSEVTGRVLPAPRIQYGGRVGMITSHILPSSIPWYPFPIITVPYHLSQPPFPLKAAEWSAQLFFSMVNVRVCLTLHGSFNCCCLFASFSKASNFACLYFCSKSKAYQIMFAFEKSAITFWDKNRHCRLALDRLAVFRSREYLLFAADCQHAAVTHAAFVLCSIVCCCFGQKKKQKKKGCWWFLFLTRWLRPCLSVVV